MNKVISFTDRFQEADADNVTIILTGYAGRNKDNQHVITCEGRLADGTVVSEGELLFFGQRSPKEIQINEDGSLAEGWSVSANGKWLTDMVGRTLDTEGYGLKQARKAPGTVVR